MERHDLKFNVWQFGVCRLSFVLIIILDKNIKPSFRLYTNPENQRFRSNVYDDTRLMGLSLC